MQLRFYISDSENKSGEPQTIAITSSALNTIIENFDVLNQNKIPLIKDFRTRYGLDLKTAKDIVDIVMSYAADRQRYRTVLTAQQLIERIVYNETCWVS